MTVLQEAKPCLTSATRLVGTGWGAGCGCVGEKGLGKQHIVALKPPLALSLPLSPPVRAYRFSDSFRNFGE